MDIFEYSIDVLNKNIYENIELNYFFKTHIDNQIFKQINSIN
jgi:hypothetical protein